MFLLMQSHREFQVVTPRSLQIFSGRELILPDVKCLGRDELEWLSSYLRSGKTLILTGETGRFDERKKAYGENPLHKLLGIADPTQKQTGISPMKFVYEPQCPGKSYYRALEEGFNRYAVAGDYRTALFNQLLEDFVRQLDAASAIRPRVEIHASPFVSTQIARVNGSPHIFIANFRGLKAGEAADQIPERNVVINFLSGADSKVYALPFLGDAQELKCSWQQPDRKTCIIPEINKGMVVWIDDVQ
jgi:hypothetical protein